MQSGANPDDIPNLLSRFHTWAEKQPESGNGNGHRNTAAVDGVRELTYEEALAHHRSRQAPQREQRAAPSRARIAADTRSSKVAQATASEIAPVIANEPEKPQITAKPSRVDTGLPVERTIPPPQVELPFAAEMQPKPAAAPMAARKKIASPAAVFSPATPTKKRPHGAGKPRVAATKKASAAIPANAAKPAATARPAKVKLSARPVKKCAGKQPEFRQVLAKSIRTAKKSAPAKKAKAPDRTRRITTRFSTAEERRIEKAAVMAGVTVSAYLRKCALAAEREQVAKPRIQSASKKARDFTPEPETRLFAQPAPASLVGGWLTLLRQRFLSSPARFSERA